MDNKIFDIIKESKEPMALVTIIETRGSAPRHNGSKMLVSKDGIVEGTIGGGKGEYNSVLEAYKCIDNKSFAVMDIARLGDDAKADLMICGGINKLLIQYIDEELKDVLIKSLGAIEKGHNVYLGTDLSTGKSYYSNIDEFPKEGYFVDAIKGVENLLILGGGYVGYEIYRLGLILGFEVSVFDDRSEFVTKERFPDAKLLRSGDLEELIKDYYLSENSYITIVTRNHLGDGACLRGVIRRPYKYVGVIGSRRKVKLLFKSMEEDGYTSEELDRVHAPIGLPINAETPEEIAVSIFAEIIRERNGKKNKKKSQ